MNFRISFGSRWLEVSILDIYPLRAIMYFKISYGHNSTRNLIHLMRMHTGTVVFKWRNKKAKVWKRKLQ